MDKKNMAVLLVLVGFVIYFFPQISVFTKDKSELTGALFAVGGIILWYIPSGSSKSRKK